MHTSFVSSLSSAIKRNGFRLFCCRRASAHVLVLTPTRRQIRKLFQTEGIGVFNCRDSAVSNESQCKIITRTRGAHVVYVIGNILSV